MNYLKTTYNDFISLKINETTDSPTKIRTTPIDFEKIDSLKKRKLELQKRLSLESDTNEKEELRKKIKVIDLKIMVAEVR